MGKKHFLKAADKVDDRLDEIKARLLRRLNADKPITVQPYRGFGNGQVFHLMGRVLQNKGLKEASESDTVWENLVAMYNRFNSNEIPHAEVAVSFQDKTIVTKADKEGYFNLQFPLQGQLPEGEHWHTVSLKLLNATQEPGEITGKFLIPPKTSSFGIISDIDDTVLRTNSSNLLKMVRLTLLNNAHTRLPFEGVAGLYRALYKGTSLSSNNPLFYVSSSPWNLYDLLEDFFELHQIPMGPFLLRDFGIDSTKFIKSGHGDHKVAQIKKILKTYPTMKFILIGDSGEKDPEIFSEIVQAFPDRISCIYIRDVSKGKRDKAVDMLIKQVAKNGIEMVVVADSLEAAKHASEKGFIDLNAIVDIQKEKEKDAQGSDELTQVLKEKKYI